MQHSVVALGLLIVLTLPIPPAFTAEPTDDDIRKILMERSIRNYPGECPCPASTDRNGDRCGERSAYSKKGGDRPLCYPSDVTPAMIERYRRTAAA